jgi:GTPase involved in cell partitioning and DNA repair
MDTTIIVAIITSAVTILLALVMFYLNKRAERKESYLQRNLKLYSELLNTITDLIITNKKMVTETDEKKKESAEKMFNDANDRFARAFNSIHLIAPQEVISVAIEFHKEIQKNNENRRRKSYEQILKKLILSIRRRLELPYKDDPIFFNVYFVG